MKTRTLIVAALLVATGCSAASTAYVAIPANGQTQTEMAGDTTDCELSALAYKNENAAGAAIGGGWLGMATNHNAYQRKYVECMTAKGYTVKD